MNDFPGYLFVYGTLLAASRHPMGDLLRAHAERLGDGSIGARLYIIEETDDEGQNAYPGAVPSDHPDDRVFGDVYRILRDPQKLFETFDDFEACSPRWPQPYEFLLRPVDVRLMSGETLRAASYLYTWDTSRATLVPSGRYERVSADVR